MERVLTPSIDPKKEHLNREPDELVSRGEINPTNAVRNAQRLLRRLYELGLSFEKDESTVTVKNFAPAKVWRKKDSDRDEFVREIAFSFDEIEIPHEGGDFGGELVHSSTGRTFGSSNYTIEGKTTDGHAIILERELKEGYSDYAVYITTQVDLDGKYPLSLEPLGDFRRAGFQFDFTNNPESRRLLTELVKNRRVPAEMVPENLMAQSLVIGHKDDDGIDFQLRLCLQNPNPESYSKCYEVEIYYGPASVKNSPDTVEIVPESHWQEDEGHFCMVPDSSYPLVPVDLKRAKSLKMKIKFTDDKPPTTDLDFLQNLPLSFDGSNQWYTAHRYNNGEVFLLHRPDWGKNCAKLLYHELSRRPIAAKSIFNASRQIQEIKEKLEQ